MLDPFSGSAASANPQASIVNCTWLAVLVAMFLTATLRTWALADTKKLAITAQIGQYERLIFKPCPFVCLNALNAKGFSQNFNHSVEK